MSQRPGIMLFVWTANNEVNDTSDCCHSTWDLGATVGGGSGGDWAPWQQVTWWLLWGEDLLICSGTHRHARTRRRTHTGKHILTILQHSKCSGGCKTSSITEMNVLPLCCVTVQYSACAHQVIFLTKTWAHFLPQHLRLMVFNDIPTEQYQIYPLRLQTHHIWTSP